MKFAFYTENKTGPGSGGETLPGPVSIGRMGCTADLLFHPGSPAGRWGDVKFSNEVNRTELPLKSAPKYTAITTGNIINIYTLIYL